MDNCGGRVKILSVHTTSPDLQEFTIPELLSLLSMHQITPPLTDLLSHQPLLKDRPELMPYNCENESFQYFPLVQLSMPTYESFPQPISEVDTLHRVLNTVCDRAVLTHSFVLVLAEANTYAELKGGILDKQMCDALLNDASQRCRFQVFPVNRSTTQKEQHQAIDLLTDLLELKGTIDLINPTRQYWMCEYHTPFHSGKRPPHEESLKRVFFGIQVAYNRKERRHYTTDFELPKRAYLGPTSTNSPLAFIMANMANIVEHQVVLDPFCGTGGLMVPASYFGATVFGSDIDARVIHGIGVGHINPKTSYKLPEILQNPLMQYNFLQYNLPLPELVRQDCLLNGFRREFFDAIICDPPYGIRARISTYGLKDSKKRKRAKQALEKEEQEKEEQEKGEQKKEENDDQDKEEQEQQDQENEDQEKEDGNNEESKQTKAYCIIPTKKLGAVELYGRLLDAAYKILAQGGMIVYLYPFDRELGLITLKDIPVHPGFELINFSEEFLTLAKSRVLISMKKIKH